MINVYQFIPYIFRLTNFLSRKIAVNKTRIISMHKIMKLFFLFPFKKNPILYCIGILIDKMRPSSSIIIYYISASLFLLRSAHLHHGPVAILMAPDSWQSVRLHPDHLFIVIPT